MVEPVGQHVNHQLVGDELPTRDIVVGYFAESGAAGDMVAQNLTRADVVKSVAVNHLGALGALAAAGSAEYYNVKHFISVFFTAEKV